jgi:Flp pilus assembly protein TadD
MTRWISWCIPIVLLLAAGCTKPPPPPKLVPPLGSRVELAAGDVWLEVEGGRERLITGAMLPHEARLILGDGARALVRLGNGTGTFLRGGTEIAIGDEAIVLQKGELWADVPADERDLGRFVAGDVTVTASGAGFDLAVAGDEVKVYVARGLAVVAAPGGRAEVENGERAVVKGGDGEPVVKPVSFWEDWTGGMADRETLAGVGGKASGRIYGIDRDNPGSDPKELQILSQEVRAIIRDGIAHTTVDQRFFNPASVDVEGWYWFTIPEGASVERFALEVNGYLVEGEMVERQLAREAYEEAIQRAFDPALLEWVDGRTYRARIFPIPATGERRVVLSYTQYLPLADGSYRYIYPMGGEGESRIQEFSLQVILGDEGQDYEIATLQDARVEEDSSMISIRRSGFVPRSDFLLELTPVEKVEPLRAYRFSSGYREADYVMLRYAPEVEWSEMTEVPGDVVLVVDTSAGGGEAERQVRASVAEAVLRALSSGDRFAVVSADLAPRVVYPSEGLAPAEDQHVAEAMEALSSIRAAGATDLGEMFNVALELVHESEQPAVAYVGDGRPTVGETTAIELAERLRRSLGDSRARLFTIAVGADANHSLLDRLARVGGGHAFRIDTPEQTVQEALRFAGTVKTPTITELEIDAGAGLDQMFSSVAGKVSEGQEVVILARTHHQLPKKVDVKGRLGGKPFERTYETKVEKGDEFGYVPFLWARMYLERLMGEGREENRGAIISLGLTYALMTPFSSFLVLDSDEAYAMQGIVRRQRHHLWAGFDVDARPIEHLDTSVAYHSAQPSDDEDYGGEGVLETEEDYYRDELVAKESAAPAQPMPEPESVDSLMGDYGPPPAPPPAVKAPKPQPRPRPASRRARESAAKSSAPDMDDALMGLRGAGSAGGGAANGATMGFASGKKGKSKSETAKDRHVSGNIGTAYGRVSERRPQAPAPRQLFTKGVCSDASRRPLAQRRILWQRRLAMTTAPHEWAGIFFDAGSRCELPRWQHRKTLLELIERRAGRPDDVRGLIASFDGYAKIQNFLRRRITRRSLDPDLVISLYSSWAVDWYSVRRGLAALKTPKERLKRLREILETHPDDPAGQGLLIETLLEADQVEEALAVATRLRRDELAGPLVLGTLCDLQAEVGKDEQARRTCSELVEFNAVDPAARERLGDLFLRHGWYEDAYRQYKTLVEMRPDDATAHLRMAAAAAGMGRVDEALRIERRVAAGDGEPGPTDPRRWARLHSAARLSRMILEAKGSSEEEQLKALERSLKRTQNFDQPTNMVFLLWEDLEAPMTLSATRPAKKAKAKPEDPAKKKKKKKKGKDKPKPMQKKKLREEFPLSDRIDAPSTGLVMIDLGRTRPTGVDLDVVLQRAPIRRVIKFQVLTVAWDGKAFDISKRGGELEPRKDKVSTPY